MVVIVQNESIWKFGMKSACCKSFLQRHHFQNHNDTPTLVSHWQLRGFRVAVNVPNTTTPKSLERHGSSVFMMFLVFLICVDSNFQPGSIFMQEFFKQRIFYGRHKRKVSFPESLDFRLSTFFVWSKILLSLQSWPIVLKMLLLLPFWALLLLLLLLLRRFSNYCYRYCYW